MKSREFKRIGSNFRVSSHERTIGFWSVSGSLLKMPGYKWHRNQPSASYQRTTCLLTLPSKWGVIIPLFNFVLFLTYLSSIFLYFLTLFIPSHLDIWYPGSFILLYSLESQLCSRSSFPLEAFSELWGSQEHVFHQRRIK